mmetsp:Transcript_7835/g.22494  ORF Transcript_7835/g.22494 Transcript_7835/m.22494 type:complete len:1069 (-) Transcript_7835:99-3305(-)
MPASAAGSGRRPIFELPMAAREGYSVVPQGRADWPVPGWRTRRKLVVLACALLALSTALLGVAAAFGRGPMGQSSQASPAGADDIAGGQNLFSVCGDATTFMHLPWCHTTTQTTTTTTSVTKTATTTTHSSTTSVTVTQTSTSTATTTTTLTTTSVTTTTVTTTPWLEAMKWVGCYEPKANQNIEDLFDDPQNTMPRPFGYTSVACARACRSYRYFFLHDDGHCFCLAVRPNTDFKQVDDAKCGKACDMEQELLPTRRCGSKSTVAVYRVESAAEVRKELESGKDAQYGKDLWPGIAGASGNALPSKDANKSSAKAEKVIMKGISYGPVPLRTMGTLPDDDFMSESTKALWGPEGRSDLALIKSLGANTVRLYGNDPSLDHTEFLDEALNQGLQVIAGISDYPYTQMPGNCLSTEFNCYTQVKEQYLQNLKRGFLAVGNAYHPALRTMILMNEPDLKFPNGPKSYCKAIISAFDAVLDAEREVGIAGQAPTFTTTFSFGVCGGGCKKLGEKPAIGQMLELRQAMQDPASVGYKPKNDLWAAYKLRFINSVNTANPATDMPWLFLDKYNELFPTVPVFVGEYHSPRTLDQQRDLETILETARDPKSMLMGISFFEFQVRYDKGGSEMSFGMFGLEAREVKDMWIKSGTFTANCLKPLEVAEIGNQMYKMDCGSVEAGVDYETNSSWTMALDHIAEAIFCCQKCREFAQCLSWTWIENAKLKTPGSPAKCVLKGGLPVGKVTRDGVISGAPYGIEGRVESTRRLRASAGKLGSDTGSDKAAAKVQLRFGQCGGQFWEGPKKCPVDFKCQRLSEVYSQCVPKDAEEAKKAGDKVLKEVPNIFVHMAVTAAFGGEGVTAAQMCPVETTTTTVLTSSSMETAVSSSTQKRTTEKIVVDETEADGDEKAADADDGADSRSHTGERAGDDADEGSHEADKEADGKAGEEAVGEADDEAGGVADGGDGGEGADDTPTVEWHGCYMHAAGSDYIYANEKGGYSSTACSIACAGFQYALLHNSGRCSCSSTEPELSLFSLVDPTQCGEVCKMEEGMNPTRYCGTQAGFAIYKLVPAAS